MTTKPPIKITVLAWAFLLIYRRCYGVGIEASASVGKGKENSHSETWQNNVLQAGEKFITRSDGKLTLDSTNVKAERWGGGCTRP